MRQTDYMTGGEDFQHMLAAHFMQTRVYYYPENARGDKLATTITMGGFGSVPIVDQDKKLLGIVSEFDLLTVIIGGKELKDIVAGEIMTREPHVVFDYTPCEEVIALLQEKRLIRVPVVNKDNTLVGILSRTDILHGYLKSKEHPPSWWS